MKGSAEMIPDMTPSGWCQDTETYGILAALTVISEEKEASG